MYLPQNVYTYDIQDALLQTTRQFHNRIVLFNTNGNIAYYISDLKSGSVTQNATGDEKLSMGAAVTNELTCKFSAVSEGDITTTTGLSSRTLTPIDVSQYSFLGKVCRVDCGIVLSHSVKIQYTTIGTFKITEVNSDDNWQTITIKGYDVIGTNMADDKFSDDNPSSYAVKDIIDKIARDYRVQVGNTTTGTAVYVGITPTRELTEDEYSALLGLSVREVVGILAGVLGCNARINTINKLVITFFTDPYGIYYDEFIEYLYEYAPLATLITEELQWQHGFKKLQDNLFYLNKVTSNNNSGDGENTSITVGTGTGVAFENPIIKERTAEHPELPEDLTNIYVNWLQTSYQPCEVEWRGSPFIEAGDIVTVCCKPYIKVTTEPSDWEDAYLAYYLYDEDNDYYYQNTNDDWSEVSDICYRPTKFICYVQKQVLNFCGGFKSIITCNVGDVEIDFDTKEVTERELRRTTVALQQAMLDSYNKITGAAGGYVLHLDLDNDGAPDNIFITDVEITEDDFEETSAGSGIYQLKQGLTNQPTAVIRMNKNGIGIAQGTNAGTSANIFQTTLTADGIVANSITTGLLSGGTDTSVFSFNLETGLLTASNVNVTGGTIRIGTNNYYTEIASGCISQYSNGGNLFGRFVPVASQDLNSPIEDEGVAATTYYEGVYYDSDNTEALTLGYIQTETIGGQSVETYNRIAEVKKTPDGSGGRIITQSNNFVGFIHQRYLPPPAGSIFGTTSKWETKFGVGSTASSQPIVLDKYESQMQPPSSSGLEIVPSQADVNAGHSPAGVGVGTMYGYHTSNEQWYPMTRILKIPSNMTELYVSFDCASYGKQFLYLRFGYYQDSSTYIRYNDTLKIVLADEDGSVWSTYQSPTTYVMRLSDLPDSVKNGATHFEVVARPEGGHLSYWIGWGHIGIAYILNSMGSCGIECRNLDENAEYARLDVYQGTKGTKFRMRAAQISSSWTYVEFYDDNTIKMNGHELKFESDGLYYDDRKLKYN